MALDANARAVLTAALAISAAAAPVALQCMRVTRSCASCQALNVCL